MSTNLESLRHYRSVTDSASEQDLVADGANQALSEENLIRRLARDRREGRDTPHDLRELLKRSGRANRAALDRLAE
jgi:hypothetical protein